MRAFRNQVILLNYIYTYSCCIEWGDGDAVCSEYNANIGYCQLTHGYRKGTAAKYLVTAYYCNYLNENESCCDINYKYITVDH